MCLYHCCSAMQTRPQNPQDPVLHLPSTFGSGTSDRISERISRAVFFLIPCLGIQDHPVCRNVLKDILYVLWNNITLSFI